MGSFSFDVNSGSGKERKKKLSVKKGQNMLVKTQRRSPNIDNKEAFRYL